MNCAERRVFHVGVLIWLAVWVLISSAQAASPFREGRPLTAREMAQGFRQGRLLVQVMEADREKAVEAGRAGDVPMARERAVGVTVARNFDALGRGLRVVVIDDGEDVAAAITRLQATGLYSSVEMDRVVRPLGTPNDPRYGSGELWGLHNTGLSAGLADADIDAPEAWDTRSDASSVIVAVIDSGVRLTHEDLVANLWTNSGEVAGNGRDDDGNGYIDDVHGINAITGTGTPTDDSGHGTHVAGSIGARGNNGLGVVGVAQRVQLMPLKFLPAEGSGSTSDVIECINYAVAKGALIINASYGAETASAAETVAMQSARAAGILFVAAAGNDGASNDRLSQYPASYLLDNIVAVAATTRQDRLATFSNFGSGLVELGAPGSEILSTLYSGDSAYGSKQGTSMATPHVAGALALIRAQFPGETPRRWINRLLRAVDRVPTLSGQVQTGGRLNLQKALTGSDYRPFNDDFAERSVLRGATITARSTITDASRQTGEPNHGGANAGGSLWWTWTAPAAGDLVLATAGSAFDTVLGVYTGDAIAALTKIAENDDGGTNGSSRLAMSVSAGQIVQIAVGAKADGASGLAALTLTFTPVHDQFATPADVAGASWRLSDDLSNATRETGEPVHAATGGAHSLWYRWTAPASRAYWLSARSVEADLVVGVYTGTAVGSLATVTSNNDAVAGSTDETSDRNALVRLMATAGTTYRIAVSTTGSTEMGGFELAMTDADWVYPIVGSFTGSPTVAADGSVYVGGTDGALHALTSTGTLRWAGAAGGSIDMSTAAIGADGTVYVGDAAGYLNAFTAAGVRTWRQLTGGAISSSPAVGSDGTVYVRSADGKLHAYTSAGTLKWTATVGGDTYGSVTIADDGTLYVPSLEGKLYALRSDGTSRWTYDAVGAIYSAPALAADGTIYITTLTGEVHAISSEGAMRWKYVAGGYVTSSVVIARDGSLYFGCYDGNVYALTKDGTRMWTYATGDEMRAATPALGSDGTVYIGSYNRDLHAISPQGVRVRTWPTGDIIRSSPVLAAGKLYFGGNDGRLYAIDVGQNALSSAWPMHRYNHTRQGRRSVQAPAVVTVPSDVAVDAGGAVTLAVGATGDDLVYQWYRDGVAIAGATSASLVLSPVVASDMGGYTLVVTNAVGTVTSARVVVFVNVAASADPAHGIGSLSTRAQVIGGGEPVIGGIVLSGVGSRQLVFRAVGPTLRTFGVTGAVPDPVLVLNDGATDFLRNEGWSTQGGVEALRVATASVGLFAFAAESLDSALLVSLAPGNYTAKMMASGGVGGVGLIQVYPVGDGTTRLKAISTRAKVGSGESLAIAGFSIQGGARRILIRGVGPTLAGYGVTGALSDPMVTLYSEGGTALLTNDNWGSGGDGATVATSSAAVGLFALPAGSKDACLLVTLPTGNYTVHLAGVSGAEGVALVEVYEVF